MQLSEIEEILERTPIVLDGWLSGLSAALVTATDGPESWSPHDVVGHLGYGEQTDWIERARIILSDSASRNFAPFDRHGTIEANRKRSTQDLLDEFRRRRGENLATLASWELQAFDLTRMGVHPQFGQVTLQQLLATWAVHDLSHIAQIARVLCRCNAEAIGPWREYMPITG